MHGDQEDEDNRNNNYHDNNFTADLFYLATPF